MQIVKGWLDAKGPQHQQVYEFAWSDPEFKPGERAFYHARVLEIPTPRWSTIDAANLGLAVPEGLPVSIQERAWSSPIWYAPAA